MHICPLDKPTEENKEKGCIGTTGNKQMNCICTCHVKNVHKTTSCNLISTMSKHKLQKRHCHAIDKKGVSRLKLLETLEMKGKGELVKYHIKTFNTEGKNKCLNDHPLLSLSQDSPMIKAHKVKESLNINPMQPLCLRVGLICVCV